jgi:UDP-N-acetylglucosamine 2-epimerase (non-hydrolysing)
MLIDIIAGARPNFMKIAPIIESIEFYKNNGYNIDYRLIHTGQHYDQKMSGSFFNELNIPNPKINLEVGSGTQAEQTAKIMIEYEKILISNPSNLCLVVGDVTSTMACAVTAKKMCVNVAHVEAGIRSGDLSMPEEINRLLTDSITDYFFTTSEFANTNLVNCGVGKDKIFFVGNTMIDTLLKNIHKFKKPTFWNSEKLETKNYLVLTLHRPSNVDSEFNLNFLLNEIVQNSRNKKIIFPVHPRTLKNISSVIDKYSNLFITQPMTYLEFNYLVSNSLAVITDSGGITEETTVMGIPCITLRDSTERPETCSIGTNELIGTNHKKIKLYLDKLFENKWKKGEIPPLWDGKTSERIVSSLLEIYNLKSNH